MEYEELDNNEDFLETSLDKENETEEQKNIEIDDKKIQFPSWDLTPPFDTIDRSKL